MYFTSAKAVWSAVRMLFKSWTTLPLMFVVYGALLLALYFFVSTRGRDDKIARHLHADRVLERGVAVEPVKEENSSLVTKLTRAIPVGPTGAVVVEIQIANTLELLSAGGNRILNHQVSRRFTRDVQFYDQQIAGVNLASQRRHRPFQLVVLLSNGQTLILARDIQIR